MSNMVLYLVLMIFIFIFDALTNKKMLYVNLLLLFVILPIFSSLLNAFAFSQIGVNAPGKGFSAIVAGVFGYLAFSTLHYIVEYHGVRFDRGIFQLMWTIFYVNAVLILLIYGYYPASVVLFVLLLLSFYYTHRDFGKILDLIQKVNRWHRMLIFGSLIFCLCAVTQGLFPETLKYDGMVVNIFAHYVGYIFGFFVPAVVSVYVIERRKKIANLIF